jgi:phosphohistidine phosphatase
VRTLLLLRHAKSSRDDERLADFDRPLARRGLKAAPRMGRLLAEQGMRPERILCSPAVRTRQTLELFTEAAALDVPATFAEDLYEADVASILEVVSQAPADCRTLLVVGHNPGLEETLAVLTGTAEHLPTGALVQIELPCDDWSCVAPGDSLPRGRQVHLWKPRDLD